MPRYITGQELIMRSMRRPLTELELSGRSPEEIIAAIDNHEGFPNVKIIAGRLKMRRIRLSSIVKGNPKVRAAWHAKVTREAKAVTLKDLFKSDVAFACAEVPSALQHKRDLTIAAISTFSGNPTFVHLAEGIMPGSGKFGAHRFLVSDPVARKAAEAKFLEILDGLSAEEIVRRKLHVHVGKISSELKRLVDKKIAAAGIKVKRP